LCHSIFYQFVADRVSKGGCGDPLNCADQGFAESVFESGTEPFSRRSDGVRRQEIQAAGKIPVLVQKNQTLE